MNLLRRAHELKTKAAVFSVALTCIAPFSNALAGDHEVEYLNRNTSVAVDLSTVKSSRGTVVYAYLFNRGSAKQTVYYRVGWFDASGKESSQRDAWTSTILHPYQRETVQVVAPVVDTVDYKFHVSIGKSLDPATWTSKSGN